MLSLLGWIIVAATIIFAAAHPEAVDHSKVNSRRGSHLTTHSTSKCARQLEARREEHLARRRMNLFHRRQADGSLLAGRGYNELAERNKYATIQNTTCVLAPETVWGPYGVDGELYRHDVREGQSGVDLYLDIGVIDVETCKPLPDAWLTIWSCNATGSYSGFTGINPNTASVLDGWTQRSDGTTDERTFLRGISRTDTDGMSEFLTIFPGYYISRTTHIHLTVQTNVTGNNTSYSSAAVQHLGQLFFTEELINSVYQLEPYYAHLSTLNRTTNSADSLYSSASSGGYSAVVSTALLGESIADGLVGYITVGINRTATAAATTGGSVNVVGALPTLTATAGAQAAAYSIDASEGYLEKH